MAIDQLFRTLNSTIVQLLGADNVITYYPSTGLKLGQPFDINAVFSSPKDQDDRLLGTYIKVFLDGNAIPAGVQVVEGDTFKTDDGTFYSVKDPQVDAANGISMICRVSQRPFGQ